MKPFEFDQMAQLFKDDPLAFENQREEMVEELIQSAPSDLQRRLRGIQFQVDMERAKAKTPMDACLRIYGKMMDEFHGRFAPAIRGLAGAEAMDAESTALLCQSITEVSQDTAQVLPFRPRSAG